MNRNRFMPVIMMLIAATGCHPGIEPIHAEKTIPVRIIYSNQQCASDKTRILPVRDTGALQQWWQLFAKRQLPAMSLPPALGNIDFDRTSLFVVYMGSQPTAGYGIELYAEQAIVRGHALTIPVTWTAPAREAIVALVLTSPCAVISVPGSAYETVTARDRQGKTLSEVRISTGSGMQN